MTTRTLDRKVYYDPKSLDYRIQAVVDGAKPRSRKWRTPVVLDQGQEGACVGFAWTGWAASSPGAWKPTLKNKDAFDLYHAAQRDDETPGENYEGSSTLGGAKASEALGRVESYHWAKTIDEIVLALGNVGPVVVGINWYEGLYTPENGKIQISGPLVGGHDILINAVDIRAEQVRLHNSWGRDWGVVGEAWMSLADLERLVIKESGDCCLPIKKAQTH